MPYLIHQPQSHPRDASSRSSSSASSEYTSGASESGSYSESDTSSHTHTSQSSSDLSPDSGGSEPGSEGDDMQGGEGEKLLPSMGTTGVGSEGMENLCYDTQVIDIGILVNNDSIFCHFYVPYFVFYSWLVIYYWEWRVMWQYSTN